MKPGDLITLNTYDYPQYREKTGILVEKVRDGDPSLWRVAIAGRVHSYPVVEKSIEVINENR